MSETGVRRPHLPEQVGIDAYGAGGFRFGGMSHRGSILALPSGLYAWQVASADGLAEADFAELSRETAPIDVLLIGTGLSLSPIPEALRRTFRERRISADVMRTGDAVRTYNVLLAENRRVAGAFVAVA